MKVDLSAEQAALADATRQMLARNWTTSDVRLAARPEGSGHDQELWQRIADAGWLTLAFPEEAGGDGGSLLDLAVIVREAGRALVPTTLTSTLYAGFLLNELGTAEQIDHWLRPILQGKLLATVAYAETSAVHDPAFYQTTVRGDAGGWRLCGRKLFVENAGLSDLVIVAGRVAPDLRQGGFGLSLVPKDAVGLEVRPHTTFGHDAQDEVALNDLLLDRVGLLGFGHQAVRDRWSQVTQWMTALTALEMVGGGQAVLDQTRDYLVVRHAFGKPIGSFQAVQHHMANAAMALKGAELAGWQAIWRLAEGRPATRETAIAKASAGRAYRDITMIAHQLWGGMGYTEESDLHLWSRRAVTADLRYGSATWHLQRLADQLAC